MIRNKPLKPASLWLLIPTAIVPFLGSVVYFKMLDGSSGAGYLYAITKLFTLVWPLLVFRFIGKGLLPHFHLNLNFRAVLAGILSGIAISSSIFFMCFFTTLGEVVVAHSDKIRAKVLNLGIYDTYIYFSLFLALFHSLIEEYYWRWCLFHLCLTRFSANLSHLIAGVFFGSHHFIVLSEYFPTPWAALFFLGVCMGGVIWSDLYQRLEGAGASWLSHMLVDICILSIGYTLIF